MLYEDDDRISGKRCTDHSDSLKVHFSPAEFLPAVVFVTLAFGHPAVLTGGLEYITDQRAPTDLICRDLHSQSSQDHLRITSQNKYNIHFTF